MAVRASIQTSPADWIYDFRAGMQRILTLVVISINFPQDQCLTLIYAIFQVYVDHPEGCFSLKMGMQVFTILVRSLKWVMGFGVELSKSVWILVAAAPKNLGEGMERWSKGLCTTPMWYYDLFLLLHYSNLNSILEYRCN